LIAEFIYLDMAKIDIYEFVKRAGIEITYPGMCMWVSRNFGTGKEAVQKAAEIVQAAVDQGEFTSPYFSPNRPHPGTSHEISPPRNSRPALVALVNTPASALSETANAAATPTEKRTDQSRPVKALPESPEIPPQTVARTPDAEGADAAKEAQKQARLALLAESMTKFDSPFKKARNI
jgi:hypothetical protein